MPPAENPQHALKEVTKGGLNFAVSPNPTSSFVRINLSVKNTVDAQLNVMNLIGQTLIQRTQGFTAGENQFDVNLQALPTGTYLVRIMAGETQGVVKVVKD